MAWPTEENRVPTSILRISVTLLDSLETDIDGDLIGQSAEFSLYIVDQNGQPIKEIGGDLVPHITTAQRNALMDFMTSLRAQAETQLLP